MSARATVPRERSWWGQVGPLVLARMVCAGVTLLIPLVLARLLSLEVYGTYSQLFLLATTLQHVLPFGVVQSLYYFLPRAREARPWVVQTLLFMSGAGLVAAVLVWGLLEQVAGWFGNPALLEHRGALAAYAGLVLGATPLEGSLTSRGHTRAAAVVYLVSDTLRMAALVGPCLLGAGLKGMMLAVVAQAGLRYVAAWAVGLASGPGPLLRSAGWREQLTYAVPFGLAIALAAPQQSAHMYAVAGAVGPALYALYRVGCFQLPVVDLLYTPVSEVLMVRLGELERTGREQEGVEAFREAGGRLAYALLPWAAFLFAAAPEFISTLFGVRFLPAVPLFRVSVLGVVLAVLPMDGVLRARGRTRGLLAAYAVKAAVTVPLVWLAVRWWGMAGGVLSWALAEVVGKVALLVQVPGALSAPGRAVHLRQVVPWRELGRASLAAVAAAGGVFMLRAGLGGVWSGLPEGVLGRALPLALAALLFTGGYMGALQALGVKPLAVLAGLRARRG